MTFRNVIIQSDDWSPLKIQQCTSLPRQLIDPLIPYGNRLEEYLSINLMRTDEGSSLNNFDIQTRILIRISATSTQEQDDGEFSFINCDMRVREICITEKLTNFISSSQLTKFNQSDILIALVLKDMLCGFWEWCKMFYVKIPEQIIDTFSEEDPSQEFQISKLNCGIIRRMNVTVIFDDLFLLNPDFDLIGISKELVREFFKIYSIHVRPNSIIDVRKCPFLSSISPPVSFIFVHDCVMSSMQIEIGRLNNQTEISIRTTHDISYFRRILLTLSNNNQHCIAGLEIPFEIISKSLEIQPRKDGKCIKKHFYSGLILSGAPGSGKKLVVHEAAKRYAAELCTFNLATEEMSLRHDFEKVAGKLTKIFQHALQSTTKFSYPIIVLIENIDTLHSKDTGFVSRSNLNKSLLTNHICDLLDDAGTDLRTNAPLVVIGTTSKPYLISEKIRMCHRLPQEVFIKVPNITQRVGILKSIQLRNPQFSTIDIDLLGKQTPGFVARDLIRLVHVATLQANITDSNELNEEHIKYALRRVLPSVLQGSVGVVDVNRDSSALNNVSGLDSVKMDLIKTIVWPLVAPEVFKRMGIKPPKGIILYGPSGCGKTTLVRAITSAYETNFLSVSSAELFSSAVGDSEKIISHLFHRARLASPCVLFIDELDAVVGSRDSKSSGKSVSETILSTLLTEMDGVGVRSGNRSSGSDNSIEFGQHVVVVGATNRPHMIDSALLRPGRFDRLVPVPPPNKLDRIKLLQNSLKMTAIGNDVNLEELADKTERFSGADIVNLCREAGLFALSEDINTPTVKMQHYLKALSQLSPSISNEYLDSFYEYASRGSSVTVETDDLTKNMKSLNLKSTN